MSAPFEAIDGERPDGPETTDPVSERYVTRGMEVKLGSYRVVRPDIIE